MSATANPRSPTRSGLETLPTAVPAPGGGYPLIQEIDIYVTPNGFFQKLVNKTRHVLESYPVKRATLEESLSEYQTYLPIDPVVIGGTDTTGEVTIDEAVLVWYDYNESMPQTAYIPPMYLTSGKPPQAPVSSPSSRL